MPGSNGGTANRLSLALYPIGLNSGTALFIFDPTNFNDPNSPSSYAWKMEDVIPGRIPTVNNIIVTYRDLGIVTVVFTLTGVVGSTDPTQAAQIVSNNTGPVRLGTVAASGRLCTSILGLNLTASNLQLSVSRAANAGPLSIAKIRLEGRVEKQEYA